MNERDLKEPRLSPWFFSHHYVNSLLPFIEEFDVATDHLLASSYISSGKAIPFDVIFKSCSDFKIDNLDISKTPCFRNSYGTWDEIAKLCVSPEKLIKTLESQRAFFNPLHYFQLHDEAIDFIKSPWSPLNQFQFQTEFYFIFALLEKYFSVSKFDFLKVSPGLIRIARLKDFHQNSQANSFLLDKKIKDFKLEETIGVDKNHFENPIVNDVVSSLQNFALYSDLPLVEVAQSLNLSKRTLQRRLDEADHQFTDLKKMTRKVLAHQLLTTTNMPINEVSQRVGFAEPSVFTKFMKEWSGHSPLSYKNLKFKKAQSLSLSPLDIHLNNNQ